MTNTSFNDHINYNCNFTEYYNILLETIILFNNKSFELFDNFNFDNINFDNKLTYITIMFTIIQIVQYAYIYYILGELSELEERILNITEDMIKEYVSNNYEKEEKEDIYSNKRKCYGLNEKNINNCFKRNSKRFTNNYNNTKNTKKPTFNEFYQEQKIFIKNNYPYFNEKEILSHARKCYSGGYAYIND